MKKDAILLLLAGVLCAALAATYWRWLGENGVAVTVALVAIGLIARRWRKRNERAKGHPPVGRP